MGSAEHYKTLCDQDVDLSTLGFGDCIYIELNESAALLRVSIFQEGHFQDEILINLREAFGADK